MTHIFLYRQMGPLRKRLTFAVAFDKSITDEPFLIGYAVSAYGSSIKYVRSLRGGLWLAIFYTFFSYKIVYKLGEGLKIERTYVLDGWRLTWRSEKKKISVVNWSINESIDLVLPEKTSGRLPIPFDPTHSIGLIWFGHLLWTILTIQLLQLAGQFSFWRFRARNSAVLRQLAQSSSLLFHSIKSSWTYEGNKTGLLNGGRSIIGCNIHLVIA